MSACFVRNGRACDGACCAPPEALIGDDAMSSWRLHVVVAVAMFSESRVSSSCLPGGGEEDEGAGAGGFVFAESEVLLLRKRRESRTCPK